MYDIFIIILRYQVVSEDPKEKSCNTSLNIVLPPHIEPS